MKRPVIVHKIRKTKEVYKSFYISFALKLLNKKAVIFSLGKKENLSIALATIKFYFEE
ncbi:hypothetical protein H2O64_16155 [Kordia sp. YSTF-M3]|uniref:Uncharacterized protein n=1 Tax=Kordia aestuariivivens TaxID=2759037 RepID=A0ABR7QCC6_9FLAO|nr:hypothetical protein [Kordia aestuariivivens]MBC8756211.1 hypothetical protein [Kordia aestuariivivens]